jgi:hypothetical protein
MPVARPIPWLAPVTIATESVIVVPCPSVLMIGHDLDQVIESGGGAPRVCRHQYSNVEFTIDGCSK